MVSSVPAHLRNPAESYAERAKKAQSIRPPNTLHIDLQATTPRSASSGTPSASRPSTSACPPQINGPSPESRPRAQTTRRTVDARSVATANEPAVPSNGSTTGAQISHTASTTLKGSPVVNVWAERIKEQKAQAKAHIAEKAQQQSHSMPNSPSGSSQSVPSQEDCSLSSSQIITNPTIHRRSQVPASASAPSNSVPSSKLTKLDQEDDHDPFIVRVPPHLSRQSSSNTNPLPVTHSIDLNGCSQVGKSPIGVSTSRDNSHSATSTYEPTGYADDHPPYHSTAPSRKNSNTSSRHHNYSQCGSVHLSRVPSKNQLETHSQPSRSGSQARIQSRSGSSASSPRSKMRGRMLPDEDMGVAEPRYDRQRISPRHRASPGIGDQAGHQSSPYPNGSEASYYRQGPGLPLMDMVHHLPHYAQNVVPPYALPLQHPPSQIPGHASPPYLTTGRHSGPSTPPYPHYPHYPAYVVGHPPILWGNIPHAAQLHHYLPNQSGISHSHINPSEPLVPQMEFGTQVPSSPVITTDLSASNAQAVGSKNDHQLVDNAEKSSLPSGLFKPSRAVVFGTVNVTESGDESSGHPLLTKDPGEHGKERMDDVAHATEQFTAFSIGVSPDEPRPSRHASRKASIRFLSNPQMSLPTARATNEPTLAQGASDVTHTSDQEWRSVLPRQAEGSGIKKPVQWEFGTTLRDDLEDEPQAPSLPSPTSHSDPPNHLSDISAEYNSSVAGDLIKEDVAHQPVEVDYLASASAISGSTITVSSDTSRPDHSMEKSENGSTSSDVWVVTDYGYGFGDMSGCGYAADVVRWEMKQREKARVKEDHREQEMIWEQNKRDKERGWIHPERQQAWRHEIGIEDVRESPEQQIDASRGFTRPRRGSYPGPHGGHTRGGYVGRRGRAFGGRYHGGRHSGGRGGFHHQRPASLPYIPSPFQVVAPRVDAVNGYSQPPHLPVLTPPEHNPYRAVPPLPIPPVPLSSTSTLPYPLDATRTHLLGQLEYYLSPQNLAQDFFLRQRMDNEGWIPIALLASFKRTQQLTTNVDLVRDVLSESSLVEVIDGWVRMAGRHWKPFILPNAPKSVVDYGENPAVRPVPEEPSQVISQGHRETEAEGDAEDCYGDGEEDDEEDIVFVIGEEAEGSWIPERKQP
ncbi:hypothetical protein BS17DRAFT_297933 [Gyrodon lividus]|nr:hypothetical protein BS17DRAFT_297933 [Gyrodon lividus]